MIPIPIPAVLRTRRERTGMRRQYHELEAALNATFDNLYGTGDRDERATLLDSAAGLTDEMAGLHTDAWGREDDATGRPMAVSLSTSAALLRQVATTERAVIGLTTWPDSATAIGGEHATELRTWTQLATTSAPDLRADYLHRLQALATRHLGDRATEVLAEIAASEEHLATANVRRPRPTGFLLPRLAVAAVFALVGSVAIIPGLARAERIGLLVTVLAAIYGALWLLNRRRAATAEPARGCEGCGGTSGQGRDR